MKTIYKIALLIVAIIVGFMYYGCESNPCDPVEKETDTFEKQENVNIFCDSRILNEQVITNEQFNYTEAVEKIEIELDIEKIYTFERKGKRINYLHIESDKYLVFNSTIPQSVMTGKIFVMVDTYFLDFNIMNTDNDIATIRILIGLSRE